MKPQLIIYWSRRDFRLTDNPALFKAIEQSKAEQIAFLPIFILENYMTASDPNYQFGYPSQYFLAQALPIFGSQFANFTIIGATTSTVFASLSQCFELTVFVNEDIHPDFYKQITKLQAKGLTLNIYNDQLTVAKTTVSGTGNFYSVFTPFKRAIWQQFLDYPEVGLSQTKEAINLSSEDLELLNKVGGIFRFAQDDELSKQMQLIELFNKSRNVKVGEQVLDLAQLVDLPDLSDWYLSESQATARFDAYLQAELLSDYDDNRNSLELDTTNKEFCGVALGGKTSKMSLALAWGLVSARTLKNKIKAHYRQDFADLNSTSTNRGAMTFLSELVWREFYKYILFHRPQVLGTEFQPKYRGTIQWVDDQTALERFTAWIQGQTGYPAVDAAMHQIAKTGWMHNRSRMMVASILTKNLGVDWRWGQEYFRAALIDMDEASNNGGWQWAASVGADPKPIRIFNPYLQAENYDKSGLYQKHWLPQDYQAQPIVEHRAARSEAMKRYGLNERGVTKEG
jgi:deoxyribodipyrimidine photo-lyase